MPFCCTENEGEPENGVRSGTPTREEKVDALTCLQLAYI